MMGWLTDFAPTLVGAVTLVDVAAKAALVLLGALATTRLLRRGSASTRHRVWTVSLTCVLALPVLSALLPAWQVPILPAPATQRLEATAPEVDTSATLRGVPNASAYAPPEQVLPRVAPGSVTEIRNELSRAQAESSAIGASPFVDARRVLIALAIAWLGGSAILLVRVFASSLAASSVIRRADPVADAALRNEALAVARSLGIRSDVRLVTSGKISMPMAWGVLRPAVLLPAGYEAWNEARRRVVLLHEMAHLKRRDCQTLLLARIVTALHWFNPLVWLAARRLQADRERACDDLVLSTGARAPDYAQHLLDIARTMRPSAAPIAAAVAMARPKELESRLLAILDPDTNRRGAPRRTMFAGIIAGGLLVFPLAALQPRAQAAQGLESAPRAVAQGVGEQLDRQLEHEFKHKLETRIAEETAVRLEFEFDFESLVEGLNVEDAGSSHGQQNETPSHNAKRTST